VGRDLISAAGVRAQISQIEKYQASVNTFHSKYGYLPGDIPTPIAGQYGFTAGSWPGQGDGNGYIQGSWGNNATGQMGIVTFGGETALLWVDLSIAKLTDGGFSTAGPTPPLSTVPLNQIGLYMPTAKIGQGNFVYVWSGGWKEWYPPSHVDNPPGDETMYFGLSAVIGNSTSNGFGFSNPGLTVSQAYAIDAKSDDGLPQSGKVLAMYQTYNAVWASGGASGATGETISGAYTAGTGAPTTNATAGSSTTCYDNNSGSGPQQYSVSQNNGAGLNCALSFAFQ